MTRKDEILEQLRARAPLAQIRAMYPSVSQRYEGLRQFLDECDSVVEAKHTEIDETDGRLKDLKGRVSGELEKLEFASSEKAKVSAEIQQLELVKRRLGVEVAEKALELKDLRNDMQTAERRGFSGSIMKKIELFEDADGPGLLDRVGTAARHARIKREVVQLEKRRNTLERKSADLQRKIKKKRKELDGLKTAVGTEEVQLQILQRRIVTALGNLNSHISASFENVNARVQHLNGYLEQAYQTKARLEQEIEIGKALSVAATSPEGLSEVPMTFVIQLYKNLHLWCEMKLQDAQVPPSSSVCSKQFGLLPWQPYKLAVLTQFVAEGLEELLVRSQARPKHEWK